MKVGDKGDNVKYLQELLTDKGYPITIDGNFSIVTLEYVKAFQRASGLTVDGIAGPATVLKLKTGISDAAYSRVAKQIGVEPAVIKAVKTVESAGSGFLPSGQIKSLFEGHVFWRELVARKITPEKILNKDNQDILYKTWTTKYYKSGVPEYNRLVRALDINREAAFASASYGLFQIMGNNYKLCGCTSPEDLYNKMCHSETKQLELFAEFVKQSGMINSLKKKDWIGFAKRYNGPSYKQNKYDTRLEQAYNNYKLK